MDCGLTPFFTWFDIFYLRGHQLFEINCSAKSKINFSFKIGVYNMIWFCFKFSIAYFSFIIINLLAKSSDKMVGQNVGVFVIVLIN